jgi:hypothetical protein
LWSCFIMMLILDPPFDIASFIIFLPTYIHITAMWLSIVIVTRPTFPLLFHYIQYVILKLVLAPLCFKLISSCHKYCFKPKAIFNNHSKSIVYTQFPSFACLCPKIFPQWSLLVHSLLYMALMQQIF